MCVHWGLHYEKEYLHYHMAFVLLNRRIMNFTLIWLKSLSVVAEWIPIKELQKNRKDSYIVLLVLKPPTRTNHIRLMSCKYWREGCQRHIPSMATQLLPSISVACLSVHLPTLAYIAEYGTCPARLESTPVHRILQLWCLKLTAAVRAGSREPTLQHLLKLHNLSLHS